MQKSEEVVDCDSARFRPRELPPYLRAIATCAKSTTQTDRSEIQIIVSLDNFAPLQITRTGLGAILRLEFAPDEFDRGRHGHTLLMQTLSRSVRYISR